MSQRGWYSGLHVPFSTSTISWSKHGAAKIMRMPPPLFTRDADFTITRTTLVAAITNGDWAMPIIRSIASMNLVMFTLTILSNNELTFILGIQQRQVLGRYKDCPRPSISRRRSSLAAAPAPFSPLSHSHRPRSQNVASPFEVPVERDLDPSELLSPSVCRWEPLPCTIYFFCSLGPTPLFPAASRVSR